MAISTLTAGIKYALVISNALQQVEIYLMLTKASTRTIITCQKYFLLLIRPIF